MLQAAFGNVSTYRWTTYFQKVDWRAVPPRGLTPQRLLYRLPPGDRDRASQSRSKAATRKRTLAQPPPTRVNCMRPQGFVDKSAVLSLLQNPRRHLGDIAHIWLAMHAEEIHQVI
jgi:hypothetical protein